MDKRWASIINSYVILMSTPGVNPAVNPPTAAPAPTLLGSVYLILAGFGGLLGFLLHLAAAKLSYDKYQSPFWAFVDFIFGAIYIPYYAFVLNAPSQQPVMGGRPRRR